MRIHDWKYQAGDSTAYLDEAYKLALRAVELDETARVPVTRCWRRFTCIGAHSNPRYGTCGVPWDSIRTTNGTWRTWHTCWAYAGEAEQALSWSAHAKEVDSYFDHHPGSRGKEAAAYVASRPLPGSADDVRARPDAHLLRRRLYGCLPCTPGKLSDRARRTLLPSAWRGPATFLDPAPAGDRAPTN